MQFSQWTEILSSSSFASHPSTISIIWGLRVCTQLMFQGIEHQPWKRRYRSQHKLQAEVRQTHSRLKGNSLLVHRQKHQPKIKNQNFLYWAKRDESVQIRTPVLISLFLLGR